MADVLLPRARRYDVVWAAGDDTPAVFTVLDETGAETNVSGWTAVAAVTAAGAEVHRWSTIDGSALAGPTGVVLVADDSAGWEWDHGRYDLRVWAPDGTRRVVAYGEMVVRPLVSRS